jgi:hypothetical protein
MALALQNIVVAIAALGAAGYFVRRMFGPPPFQSSAGAPPCAGCQLHVKKPAHIR